MVVMSKRNNRRTPKQNRNLCEQRLGDISVLTYNELVDKYGIAYNTKDDPIGLSSEIVEEKLEESGRNEISTGYKETTLHRLFEAIINPFNIVLIIVAIISYFTDIISNDEKDYLTIIIIFAMIAISSALSFFQSQRSSVAAAKLVSMIANTASVYRNNKLVEIDIRDVVVGDVIKLAAGDMIPADVRFLKTKDTFVAQSALTGESAPVEKLANSGARKHESLIDLKNIGFMGSNVISGSATAVVLLTGNDTYFGSIARSISNTKGKNSFERGVSSVSRLLIRMMLIMVPMVFVINGFLKQDWSLSLLFAVSVAVGLTPEMLPVVMTTTLATGAVKMSKQKVIVKQLGAIQTLGEMDILCTDKTGTLTEDKIIIEKYLTPDGIDSDEVLRYAYINSRLQTGLRSEIDSAVIKRARANGVSIDDIIAIDEIPFDFSRRRMSVIIEDADDHKQLITKGAVEELLNISTTVKIGGKIRKMSDDLEETILETYRKYSKQGLRMLAVAVKSLTDHYDKKNYGVSNEEDLTFVGLIGFFDPPKESAKAAIAELKTSGVRTIVLTGDNLNVAKLVCEKVGIDTEHTLVGLDVDQMSDAALLTATRECQLFAKLNPAEKERIIRVLQESGHTVGYMGDGINDAPPLHRADVSVSVDTAVDIAKETASIILLKKDLTVLSHGVTEGRRTFGNVSKYIKMAVSSNFGNMVSVMVASIVLPFLPMLPIHILIQNLISDLSQIGLPLDNVDDDYLLKPRKWSPKSITTFMLFMGPVSSLFDIICFVILWFVFGFNSMEQAILFQTGWFILGVLSQVLVILIARTGHIPFLKGNRPGKTLVVSTLIASAAALILVFSPLSRSFNMQTLPPIFLVWLIGLLLAYFVAIQLIKSAYKRLYNQWF